MDENESTSELPALIEERRRYEGWLAALDARRESTPQHVFERVQADYRGRLQRVAERLASHRQAIEEEQASIRSRLSLLEAEERLRRDERAELELRAHVGELADEEAKTAFEAVDESIGQLVSEKETLDTRMKELQALLDEGKQADVAPVSAEASAAAEPKQQEHAVQPEKAEAAPKPAKPEEPAPRAAPRPTPAAGQQAAATGGRSTPSQQPNNAPPQPAPRTPSGTFDELAFLNTVVGKEPTPLAQRAVAKEPTPLVQRAVSDSLAASAGGGSASGIVRDDQSSPGLLSGLEAGRRGGHEPPLAANVPANTPIALRMSGAIEQSKTLKCTECGAMNYPTEWYCERCGAELAAL